MTHETTTLSRRYADYLLAGGRSERAIETYLYVPDGFARFLGERAITEATAEDILAYQVDVAARGLSDSSVRVATYALRGFFHKILDRHDWNFARLPKRSRPSHRGGDPPRTTPHRLGAHGHPGYVVRSLGLRWFRPPSPRAAGRPIPKNMLRMMKKRVEQCAHRDQHQLHRTGPQDTVTPEHRHCYEGYPAPRGRYE